MLIKRTSAELKLIAKYLSTELKTKFEKLWLYEDDMIGATEGLFRLQVTYRINSSDFASGIIMGRQVRNPLSAHDIFTIGNQALNLTVDFAHPREENFHAIEYLQIALDKIKNGDDPDQEVNLEEIALTLASVYNKTGQYEKAAATVDFLLKTDPALQTLKNEYLALHEEFGHSKVYVRDPYDETITRTGEFSWETDNIYMHQTCRGERVPSLEVQSKLRCRYISKSAFSKIGPFRVEELYNEPLVYLYYNVLFDSEIEAVKEIAGSRLRRGTNFGNGGSTIYSDKRITKTTFLKETEHEALRRIGRRTNVSFQ